MIAAVTMSPWSRERWSVEIEDEDGVPCLTDAEPFPYRPEADNRTHVAREGDTWAGLAHRYFPSLPRACGLWWAVADYQPAPVVDPTIAIPAGTVVVIPSERVIRQLVFDSGRRREQ